MRHHEAAQARLRERFRQLYKSDFSSFPANVSYFLQWTETVPPVKALIDSVRRAEPDFDPAGWFQSSVTHRGISWPANEVQRVKAVLWMLDSILANPDSLLGTIHEFGHGNLADNLRSFNDVAVEPLIDYLDERLAAETDLLYLLERYRRRVQWFEQDRLWEEYKANTTRGETLLDRDLRSFMFAQGIDYPFSQLATASGLVDIAIPDSDDRPVPIEVKLYNGGSYGTGYLAKGVGQALRYAEDLDQPDCYLVVFNLTEDTIELPNDDSDGSWPPRLFLQNRTVFIVVVPIAPRDSASKSGSPKSISVAREDLV